MSSRRFSSDAVRRPPPRPAGAAPLGPKGWGLGAALLACLAAPADTPAASTPAPQAFAVVQIELVFQNGRGDITVPRNYPGLRVHGRIRFRGAGVFDAFWVVDGRILAQITDHVMFGDVMWIATPWPSPPGARHPFLPTFEPGPHTVTLQVRSPQVETRIPAITYFVTADEFVPPPSS